MGGTTSTDRTKERAVKDQAKKKVAHAYLKTDEVIDKQSDKGPSQTFSVRLQPVEDGGMEVVVHVEEN